MSEEKPVVFKEVGEKEVPLPAEQDHSDCDEDIMAQYLKSMTSLLGVLSLLDPSRTLEPDHVAEVFDMLYQLSCDTLEAFERSY